MPGPHTCHTCLRDSLRFVGDPVDVVTGALVESAVDFTLPGDPPIAWGRHSSSAWVERDGPFGWGQRSSYDHRLRAVVDGLKYDAPGLEAIVFPYTCDGQRYAGHRLSCIGGEYHVSTPEGAIHVFSAAEVKEGAWLRRVIIGRGALQLSRDLRGRLVEISDLGRTRRITLELRGERIIALSLQMDPSRPNGAPLVLMRYIYSEAGELVAAVDRYGNRETFIYDAAHRMTARTDRNGYRFNYTYDLGGRCVGSWGDGRVQEVHLRYLDAAQTTAVTRADGGEWLYRHDDTGSVTEIVDPYGGVRRFVYDREGHIMAETDAAGDTRSAVRSPSGSLLAWRTARGGLRPAEVPSGPLPHEVPDSVCSLELGRLAARVRAAAPFASAGLEPLLLLGGSSLSRLFADRDPRGEAGCRRDELGLLLQESPTPTAPARRWAYTPNGWVRHYTDATHGRHEFEYQGWNHRITARDPLMRTIRYEYTPQEQISAVTDPAGNRHMYRYDLRGELTAVHHSGALSETYEHDVAGRMTARRDCRHALLTRHEYGEDGLQSLRELAGGEVHRYTYTPDGRLAGVGYGEHALSFAYTASGRRCRDMRDGRGVEHIHEAGRLAQTSVFKRFTTHYRWVDGSTLELKDPTGKLHTVFFGANGTVSRLFACGVQELSDYDSLGRCRGKHLFSATPGVPVWRRTFEYGPEGDLLGEYDSETGTTVVRHDAAHQISEVERPDGRREQYRYDAGGSLVEAPTLDEVEVGAGNRLIAARGAQFSYDDRGNVAVWIEPGRTRRFHRDALDRLRRIDGMDVDWSADYDPLGRRTHKAHGDDRTEYFWDTDRLAAEQRGGRLRVYVYVDDFALVPSLVVDYDSADAESTSGRVYILLCDQRGAPIAALDADGQRVWSTSLSPYGVASPRSASSADSWDLSLRLAGQIHDPETGLSYHRFRYYSPDLGRYLEEDPSGTGGGLNLYAYTHNPLVQFDPRGLGCGTCGQKKCECPQKKDSAPTVNDANAAQNTKPKPRPPPAPDNYRGRFQAEQAAKGKQRLPDDWDAHHCIPQEYRNHPEFKDFDFDAPSNIRGVRAKRSGVNTHQDVTNRWSEFRQEHPKPTRAQIEAFERQVDAEFQTEWWP